MHYCVKTVRRAESIYSKLSLKSIAHLDLKHILLTQAILWKINVIQFMTKPYLDEPEWLNGRIVNQNSRMAIVEVKF